MRLVKGRSFYKEPWYNSYRCMKSRCYREKDPSYKYYGGRGIKVCDEWHDIQNFEAWVKDHIHGLMGQRLIGLIATKIMSRIIADGQQCLNRTKIAEEVF